MKTEKYPCIEEVLEQYDFRKPLPKKKPYKAPEWLLVLAYLCMNFFVPILGAYCFMGLCISGFSTYKWSNIEWELFMFLSIAVIFCCKAVDSYGDSLARDFERDQYLRDQALKKKYGM